MKFIVEFEDSFSDADETIRKIFAVEAESAEAIKADFESVRNELELQYRQDYARNEVKWYGCTISTTGCQYITADITPLDRWIEKNSPAR